MKAKSYVPYEKWWKLQQVYVVPLNRQHSLPSADSRRAVVSFWQKDVHNTG